MGLFPKRCEVLSQHSSPSLFSRPNNFRRLAVDKALNHLPVVARLGDASSKLQNVVLQLLQVERRIAIRRIVIRRFVIRRFRTTEQIFVLLLQGPKRAL